MKTCRQVCRGELRVPSLNFPADERLWSQAKSQPSDERLLLACCFRFCLLEVKAPARGRDARAVAVLSSKPAMVTNCTQGYFFLCGRLQKPQGKKERQSQTDIFSSSLCVR